MQALIADKLTAGTDATLSDMGLNVTLEPALSGDSLVEALKRTEPDILVVRSTRVEARHLEAASRLALVIRAGAGVNTIDLEAASRRGIFVANCPGKNAVAVAELTMGHLINLDRRIADNVESLRGGHWNKKEYGNASGLAGRRLAVLGCGSIGREVIRRALAFDMKIVGWSRGLSSSGADKLGIEYAESMEAAVRNADAVSVHLALCEDTRRIVDHTIFDAMAPGTFFINTARAELVDHQAMLHAMHGKNIRVALDVFPNEPSANEESIELPLLDERNLYGTHHIGASTRQAESAVAAEVIRIIESHQRGETIPNWINKKVQSQATHTLIVRHADRVGVLARVLDALRDAGHNVQEIQNLLFEPAAAACARVSIVGRPSNEVLSTMGSLPDIFSVVLAPR